MGYSTFFDKFFDRLILNFTVPLIALQLCTTPDLPKPGMLPVPTPPPNPGATPIPPPGSLPAPAPKAPPRPKAPPPAPAPPGHENR